MKASESQASNQVTIKKCEKWRKFNRRNKQKKKEADSSNGRRKYCKEKKGTSEGGKINLE